jgi:hypothetical protein
VRLQAISGAGAVVNVWVRDHGLAGSGVGHAPQRHDGRQSDRARSRRRLPLLLAGDYDLAIDQAIEHFKADRPNLRIYPLHRGVGAFRFVLLGTGTILPTTGLDRWVDGGSEILAVFTPYTVGAVDNVPLDANTWRAVSDPPDGSGPITVLELLDAKPSVGSVMRLEYARPHVLADDAPANSSIRAGDVTAFETLLAAKICEAAARRYVQNTGSSTFQTETVDRRTQSDVMKARAKELMGTYAEIVGKPSESTIGAASVRKMVIGTSHGRGRLWHRV